MLKPFLTCLFLCLTAVFPSCQKPSNPEPSGEKRIESSLQVDNHSRKFVLNLPPSYDSNATTPLVIFLHGFGGSITQAESDYQFSQKGNEQQFAVVYPEGVQNDGILGLRSWNAGTCCDYASEHRIDDVKFIGTLLDHLLATYPKLNARRVYVTGISNGAMMCYRLAAELPDRIAAVAVVSGPMMVDTQPTHQLPILHIHSIQDTKVPYAGGSGLGGYVYPPVENTLNLWATTDGCNLTNKSVTTFEKYTLTEYTSCTANTTIKLYLTNDGGHSWPGSVKARPAADDPSTAFVANDIIWDLFNLYEISH